MGYPSPDLGSIPVHQLAPRRLHLGPFASGGDLAKFLCLATVGATVAAVTSIVVWLPFLALGGVMAFVRVEDEPLDSFALGYCRFRWRSSGVSRRDPGGPTSNGRDSPSSPRPWIRAGGIPIAYLPPAELQRLFEEWRSTLATFDRPIGCRIGGERFSPLPFLPASSSFSETEQVPLDSYRELVHTILHGRYRRVVELTVWLDRSDASAIPIGLHAQLDELISALGRMGIPVRRTPTEVPRGNSAAGAAP